MNRDDAKTLLPVIQAFAEGKPIEYCDPNMGWVPVESASFNLGASNYRIKLREPRVLWAVCPVGNPAHSSTVRGEADARAICEGWNRASVQKYEVSKFVEVVE